MVSIGTNDTDLKTPGPSRHTTPLAQARAPLLNKHHVPLSDDFGHGADNHHTLFPTPKQASISSTTANNNTTTHAQNHGRTHNRGGSRSTAIGQGLAASLQAEETPQRSSINSPTGARAFVASSAAHAQGSNSRSNVKSSMGYGTLQHPKHQKANMEVVMRSVSDGNVARL